MKNKCLNTAYHQNVTDGIEPPGNCVHCRKMGAIDPTLKAKIDSLQKAIDSYTNCLVMPCFDDDVEFFKDRIAVLVACKWELVRGI